jgi:micrococcal nuclease
MDRFGRLLAYVYVERTLVNEEILRQGYAQLLTIPPNVKYANRFRNALFEARKKKRGMWGPQ